MEIEESDDDLKVDNDGKNIINNIVNDTCAESRLKTARSNPSLLLFRSRSTERRRIQMNAAINSYNRTILQLILDHIRRRNNMQPVTKESEDWCMKAYATNKDKNL
jgi:hypothetical protein